MMLKLGRKENYNNNKIIKNKFGTIENFLYFCTIKITNKQKERINF